MITETITLNFETVEQQKRFHARLKSPVVDVQAAVAAAYEDAAKIAEEQHAYWTKRAPQSVDVAACLDIAAAIRARAKEKTT